MSWINQETVGTAVTPQIWGETELNRILSMHPAIKDQFFKTESLKAKKKTTSRAGDAEEWQSISPEEAEEIRQHISGLVEESARRKRRRSNSSDYSPRNFGNSTNISSPARYASIAGPMKPTSSWTSLRLRDHFEGAERLKRRGIGMDITIAIALIKRSPCSAREIEIHLELTGRA